MTFFVVKPDVLRRHLLGAVLRRIEVHNFEITGLRMVKATTARVCKHYAEHRDKDFFPRLVGTLVGESVVAGTCVHRARPGESVRLLRDLAGPYKERIPGTIRGDYALNCTENSIHTADSPEAAYREAAIWL